jgi:prepilin-type processing-associated H-X9-DG protein
LESVNAKANQNRAKNLFFVDGHVFGDIINNCWSHKITLRVFWMDIFATIQYNLSALLLSSADKFHDFFLQFFVADWTQVDTLLVSSSDLEALSLGL